MAKFYYGGLAVMEGVMMRGRYSAAVAVRRPDDKISLYEEVLDSKAYRNKFFRLPFLRGTLLLWEMMVLGIRMMTLSANVATGASDLDAPTEEVVCIEPQKNEKSEEAANSEKPMKLGGVSLVVTLALSLFIAITIFFVTPLVITNLLRQQLGNGIWNLVFEGVVRLAFLIIYLVLVGRVPDVQRIFGYHGAEHKAINTLESGEPLDVEHVRRASRVHTRCGTGFLLLVMVVSILVFAFVGSSLLWVQILSRILLVPVIAGLAYELMRLGAANYRFRVVRWLLAPSLALQGLTTCEPDDSMIECAITALERVVVYDTSEYDLHEGLQPDK
jgi:uncharacterized protein YqhQ